MTGAIGSSEVRGTRGPFRGPWGTCSEEGDMKIRRWRTTVGAGFLVAALALVCALAAPTAEARGLAKCNWQGGMELKVKKISCKKAEKKVAAKVINSFFGGSGVKWGKACKNGIDPSKACPYTVSKFKCTGTSSGPGGYIFASECKKGQQRVNWTIDRRAYG